MRGSTSHSPDDSSCSSLLARCLGLDDALTSIMAFGSSWRDGSPFMLSFHLGLSLTEVSKEIFNGS